MNKNVGTLMLGVGSLIATAGLVYACVSPEVTREACFGLAVVTIFLGGMCADSIEG